VVTLRPRNPPSPPPLPPEPPPDPPLPPEPLPGPAGPPEAPLRPPEPAWTSLLSLRFFAIRSSLLAWGSHRDRSRGLRLPREVYGMCAGAQGRSVKGILSACTPIGSTALSQHGPFLRRCNPPALLPGDLWTNKPSRTRISGAISRAKGRGPTFGRSTRTNFRGSLGVVCGQGLAGEIKTLGRPSYALGVPEDRGFGGFELFVGHLASLAEEAQVVKRKRLAGGEVGISQNPPAEQDERGGADDEKSDHCAGPERNRPHIRPPTTPHPTPTPTAPPRMNRPPCLCDRVVRSRAFREGD